MTEKTRYPRVSAFKKAADLRAHCSSLGIDIPCDDEIQTAPASPLAQPIDAGNGLTIGNRYAIHPMEGWDGTTDGMPTDNVRLRWRNFGISGAKLIWGGEACAVTPEGRANPNQLMCRKETESGIVELHDILLKAHKERFGSDDGLVVGLQLTHSGRFCRPFRKDKLEPAIVYRHPVLDKKFGIGPDDDVIMSDADLERLIGRYVEGARIARDAGFHFVDVKHCHGYLGHELLSGFTREGDFGGSFAGRTNFLRRIVDGIRSDQGADAIAIGVRLSAFDWVAFRPDPEGAQGGKLGPGIPEPTDHCQPYTYGFGTDRSDPVSWDLSETFQFLEVLRDLDIRLVNLTCGSPYYNPHIQRPALFPPSDGYQPPEDPLIGVARQLAMVAEVKQRFGDELVLLGSGYSYLQEYLPHVAQALVREGKVDLAGLGRMVLSYPDLPADSLTEGKLTRKRICRTFSDCTTAPRNGMISGCFPLDPYYKDLPEAAKLKDIKAKMGAD